MDIQRSASRWSSLAALFLGCLLAGCAHVVTPRDLDARRGTGQSRIIKGSAADAFAAFKSICGRSGYVVTEGSDAVYAVHSAGVSSAIFANPTDSPDQVEIEVLSYASMLSDKDLRSVDANVLANVADQAELKALKKPGSAAPAPAAPDADGLASRGLKRPDDFALIVGIEKYQSLPAADYGENDAESFQKLAAGLGVPEENTIVLTGARATRTGLAKYLEEWLPRNATPQSRVYFFYSGHGAPDPADGSAYLMPWDGDASFLRSSAYPLSRLYEQLHGLKAKEIVVALDSCFSGAGGRSVIAKGARPLVNVRESAVPADAKLTVLAAASGAEITGSLDEQRHGMFTFYLLRGLQGEADADRDGHVMVEELQAYVGKEVQRAARRQNREQTPQVLGASRGLKLY